MKIDKKKLNAIMKELKKAHSVVFYRDSITIDELDYLENIGVHYYYSSYKLPHLLIDGYYEVDSVVLELA